MKLIGKVGLAVVAVSLIMVIGTALSGIRVRTALTRMFGGDGNVYKAEVPMGRVLDCNDSVLVSFVPEYNVFLDCALANSSSNRRDLHALAESLAVVLPSRTAEGWNAYIHEGIRTNRKYLPLAYKVPQGVLDVLRTFPILKRRRFRGGFIVEQNRRAVFHYGGFARRTLGYCASGRRGNGRVGIVGNAYQDLLHGIDFRSSINIRWQMAADSMLRAEIPDPEQVKGACLLLMDIHDGSIPVIVNFGHYGGSAALGEYYNYAVGFGYEPGAVMEPLSWLVAFRDGMFHTGKELAEVRRDSSIAAAFRFSSGSYVESLRSYMAPDLCDMMELSGCRNAEFSEASSAVSGLVLGREMTMSPLCVASFYAALASGEMLRPHLKKSDCRSGIDSGQQPFAGIDLGVITGALDTSGIVTGLSSVSSYADYDVAPGAGVTYAGFFPREKPEFAVVCAMFGARNVPTEALGDVAAVASRIAERIVSEKKQE